jgi:hypothetical protein
MKTKMEKPLKKTNIGIIPFNPWDHLLKNSVTCHEMEIEIRPWSGTL